MRRRDDRLVELQRYLAGSEAPSCRFSQLSRAHEQLELPQKRPRQSLPLASCQMSSLAPTLQVRDFRMWFVATFGMSVALQMVEVIIGWSVYSHHQNALDLGWIGLAEFVPLFVLALPAGHIADRFPRRYVLACATTLGHAADAVFLIRRPIMRRAGRLLLTVVAGFGACMIVFGLSRNFELSLLALVLSGFLDMFSMNIRSTTSALATPDALRGRVTAVACSSPPPTSLERSSRAWLHRWSARCRPWWAVVA
jgi:hypothetical protein